MVFSFDFYKTQWNVIRQNHVTFASLSLHYQATYHDTPRDGYLFLASTQLGFITQLQLVYGFARAYTLKPT